MDIYKALSTISEKKRIYFLWKHDLFVLKSEKMDEKEVCEKLNVKSLSYMYKWEKSSEYLALVNIYIESQSAKDLEDIYKVVRVKALEGDDKSIKMLLELQKNARSYSKLTKSTVVNDSDNEKDIYSELEI